MIEMMTIPEMRPTKKTKNITDFLQTFEKPNTARAYRNPLVAFMDYIFQLDETRRDPNAPGGKNRPPDLEFYNELAERYIDAKGRDYVSDIQGFLAEHKEIAPTTKSSWKTAIIQWLASNRIFLHPYETRQIKAPHLVQTMDRIPTREELRGIMDHADFQTRVLGLVLISSGMRIGEALQLRWDDLDLERGMVRIRGEISKNGVPRITFVSLEALEALRNWQKHHETFVVEKRIRRSDLKKNEKEDRVLVFPVSYTNAWRKFSRALEKAGLDEKCSSTDRYRLHPHVFRKYFRTKLPQGGCSLDVVENLLGHEGYLSSSYVRLTDLEIEKEYRATESALWIFKEPAVNAEELKRVQDENNELRKEADRMRTDLQLLIGDHVKLRSEFDRLYREVLND